MRRPNDPFNKTEGEFDALAERLMAELSARLEMIVTLARNVNEGRDIRREVIVRGDGPAVAWEVRIGSTKKKKNNGALRVARRADLLKQSSLQPERTTKRTHADE